MGFITGVLFVWVGGLTIAVLYLAVQVAIINEQLAQYQAWIEQVIQVLKLLGL